MVNNLSAPKKSSRPPAGGGGRVFLIWFYSSYIYPVMPPTKSSVFSVLPQEHFLLDILGVPLVGMQSIRRALVGLPLHFPQYCIEDF